jgi:hypothetical protein
MVVGFTTTYAISTDHHICCEFESRSGRGVQHYIIKFFCDLRTDRHDIVEILLKVGLKTIQPTNQPIKLFLYAIRYKMFILLSLSQCDIHTLYIWEEIWHIDIWPYRCEKKSLHGMIVHFWCTISIGQMKSNKYHNVGIVLESNGKKIAERDAYSFRKLQKMSRCTGSMALSTVSLWLFAVFRVQGAWHSPLSSFDCLPSLGCREHGTLQCQVSTTISLEMPIPIQGHYGFHSFPVVDWFCLFI